MSVPQPPQPTVLQKYISFVAQIVRRICINKIEEIIRKEMIMTQRYQRRSINLDDISHARCKALAQNVTLSVSGVLRLLIKRAYEELTVTAETREVTRSRPTN